MKSGAYQAITGGGKMKMPRVPMGKAAKMSMPRAKKIPTGRKPKMSAVKELKSGMVKPPKRGRSDKSMLMGKMG